MSTHYGQAEPVSLTDHTFLGRVSPLKLLLRALFFVPDEATAEGTCLFLIKLWLGYLFVPDEGNAERTCFFPDEATAEGTCLFLMKEMLRELVCS